jgi:hypothetical protein
MSPLPLKVFLPHPTMPSAIPQLHPIASSSLKQGYIFSISPLDSTSTHLVLTHPSPTVSLVDAQTLQLVDTFRDGHHGDVSAIATAVEQDGKGGLSGMGSELWTAGKDGCVVRWDDRSRRPGQTIKGENEWRVVMRRLLTMCYLL